jgi:hypothetical protein
MLNFKDKIITEIRLWAWAAAVLPISALAGLFFIYWFGTKDWLSISMVVGETVMFSVAVVWWWWALYTMRRLIRQWDETKHQVKEVSTDIKDIKGIIEEIRPNDK